MAVKWAVANGNWSDDATWNDDVVPADGDLVYANGHNVTCGASVNIGNGTLTNGLNPNTNISGGKFIFSGASITIIANLEGVETYVIEFSGTGITNILINGNITSNYGINSPGNNIGTGATLTFNGNIKGKFFRDGSSQAFTRTLVINGVADRGSQILVGNNSRHSITINGIYFASVDLDSPIARMSYFEVIGKMYICDDYIVPYTIRINGVIDTTQSNVNFFPCSSSITFTASSTIVTQLPPDYPAENNVKYGVPYDKGRLVGTFQPDYPQQANVFTDVEYARVLTVADDIALYSGNTYRYNGTTWSLLQTIGETPTDVTAVVDTDALIGFLGTTTTDIVATPSTNPVTIEGNSVTAQTDEYVRYGISVYQWDGSVWVLAYTDQRSNPTIIINGGSVTAVDGDIVMYDNNCYRWDASSTLWVKLSYVGETTTDISGGSTRNQLFIVGESMKGTLETSNLPQTTLDRMANALTVDIFQQILDAHLNN